MKILSDKKYKEILETIDCSNKSMDILIKQNNEIATKLKTINDAINMYLSNKIDDNQLQNIIIGITHPNLV